jgi:hypothetical protein
MAQNTPLFRAKSFACPFCSAVAQQNWYSVEARYKPDINVLSGNEVIELMSSTSTDTRPALAPRPIASGGQVRTFPGLHLSECFSCKLVTIWHHDTPVFPQQLHQVQANQDMDPDIVNDFNEARAVFNLSPRASAALLRLCIQKLCKQLGEKGENINNDIKSLVAKGLPVPIQQALDIVRVVGNNAVHPGTINLNDDREVAARLFQLVNFVARNRLTEPKEIEHFYARLPEGSKDAIAKRDLRKS